MDISTLRGIFRFAAWGLIGALTALGFGQLPDILDPDNRFPVAISKNFTWEQIELRPAPGRYVPVVDATI